MLGHKTENFRELHLVSPFGGSYHSSGRATRAGEKPGTAISRRGEVTVTVVQSEDWTMRAKCRGMEDALFPDASDQKRARLLCSGCPVRFECLAEALDNRIEWGVWGGMTERERRLLLRQRTDVVSWTSILVGKQGPQVEALSAKRQAARRNDSKSVTSLGSD